jgi:hypothetical protein
MCTTNGDQFVKIKIHLNENIDWYCIQLELNLDLFEFESKFFIELKRIKMKIGAKGIEILLVWMMLKKVS